MNTGAPWPSLFEADVRVHAMQTKLHCWATEHSDRCFDDLFNLVHDPAFLVVAWSRVWRNKGARTAGVDGIASRSVVLGVEKLLGGLRDDLEPADSFLDGCERRRFRKRRARSPPDPDKSRPHCAGCVEAGAGADFEADFKPCSYGFRPKRRAQDAIAEIHHLASPDSEP